MWNGTMSVADGETRRTASHTNDQPLHNGPRSFIYADDLCVTASTTLFCISGNNY